MVKSASMLLANLGGAALLLLLATGPCAADDTPEWTCNTDDGFWYHNGVKTEYAACEQKKGEGEEKGDGKEGGKESAACTRSSDPAMPKTISKTCIAGPPGDGTLPRCWWTHVPEVVKAAAKSDPTLKVPLVFDMHGAGGWNSLVPDSGSPWPSGT